MGDSHYARSEVNITTIRETHEKLMTRKNYCKKHNLSRPFSQIKYIILAYAFAIIIRPAPLNTLCIYNILLSELSWARVN